MTTTGASADEWVPATPGTEGVLALGLAHVDPRAQAASGDERARGRGSSTAGPAGCPNTHRTRSRRSPASRPARIERLAHEFAEREAVGGDRRRSAARAHQRPVHGARRQRAQRTARRRRSDGRRVLHAAVHASGRPGPRADRWRSSASGGSQPPACFWSTAPIRCLLRRRRGRSVRRSRRCPSSCSFASFVDETSVLADLILPDHSFLESWVGCRARVRFVAGRGQRRRAGDEAAVPDARHRRRAARRRAEAAEAAGPAVADLRRDAEGHVRRRSAATRLGDRADAGWLVG